MISEEEYEAIKARVDRGEMPSPDEMNALMEYALAEATAAAEKMSAERGVDVPCSHCNAPIPAGTLTCEYCGGHVYDNVAEDPTVLAAMEDAKKILS